MRVLVVSNVYPPLSLGGYEQLCIGAVDGLLARGHEVLVLTSQFGCDSPRIEGHIHRVLTLERDEFSGPTGPGFLAKNLREWKSIRVLKRTIREFDPDLVFFWNMGNLTVSLVQVAQEPRYRHATAFYLSDDWLIHKPLASWLGSPSTTPFRTALKAFFRPLLNCVPVFSGNDVSIRHASFVSHTLRRQHEEAAIPMTAVRVIYNRIPVERFQAPARRSSDGVTRILYLGQVLQHKGVHTAVDAMGAVRGQRITLRIVGPGKTAYNASLEDQIREHGIEEQVTIEGPVDRDVVVELLLTHDILVFPSIWQEPFSVVLMEAMATGIAIAATSRGGTAEILIDDENALLFEAENAQDCARVLQRLADDPSLRERLGSRAKQLVETQFQEEQMVDEIEALLDDAVANRDPGIS